MRVIRILMLLFALYAGAAGAQAERSALDDAYQQVRAAQLALQQTEARRDQGGTPQAGERSGTAGGSSRLNKVYFARQARLEQEVELARQRYEEALKRWNDLK
jgi:hypothetical protein